MNIAHNLKTAISVSEVCDYDMCMCITTSSIILFCFIRIQALKSTIKCLIKIFLKNYDNNLKYYIFFILLYNIVFFRCVQ